LVESSQSRVTRTVESREMSSHENCRVTRTVESLRVIGLQARVSVKSQEISHFFFNVFCYEMAPDKLENGDQHAMKWSPIS